MKEANVKMQPLNLPTHTFRTQKVGLKHLIFDDIRRKFVSLTPEEWVRQNFVKYMQVQLMYPSSLMAIEMPVVVNGLKQRADVVVYNRKGQPVVIVECKAPQIGITNQVFDQVARYNIKLKVDYLIVTNGLVHYCAKLDHQNGSYTMLSTIPRFDNTQ